VLSFLTELGLSKHLTLMSKDVFRSVGQWRNISLVILKQQHLNHFMGLQNPFVTICHSEF
jgi:hypothetical protein